MSETNLPAIVQPAPILALIDRLARDPSVDVAKMGQFLDLQERIHARESKAEYDSAMNAAQGEMRPISKDCHNPQTRSQYASYEAIDGAIRPIYTAHGFSMSFGAKSATQPDHVIVTCRVSHRAGHTELVEMDMVADGKGAKGNDVMTRTHAIGSALSYAKRYIANLVWNLSFGESDDDGNAAAERPRQQRQEYRQEPQQAEPKRKVPPSPEKLRDRMIERLTESFNREDVIEFAVEKGFILSREGLTTWDLNQVPINQEQMDMLLKDVGDFIERSEALAPQKNLSTAVDKSVSPLTGPEDFWGIPIAICPPWMKREEYKTAPLTIRAAYDLVKAGTNERARTWFWGMVREWDPAEWTNSDGVLCQPSRESLECRKALDHFSDWHKTKG